MIKFYSDLIPTPFFLSLLKTSKKGSCSKLSGDTTFEGTIVKVSSIMFSPSQGKKEAIKLSLR